MPTPPLLQQEMLIWLFLVHKFLDFKAPGLPPPHPLQEYTRGGGRGGALGGSWNPPTTPFRSTLGGGGGGRLGGAGSPPPRPS